MHCLQQLSNSLFLKLKDSKKEENKNRSRNRWRKSCFGHQDQGSALGAKAKTKAQGHHS